MTGEEPCANVGGGLIVANNETIRSFLHSASQNPQLSQSLCESASNLSHENSIPYKTLRDIWSASPSFSRPNLRLLFTASNFFFSSPKPREKSEELKERLRKLAELAEKNEYKELVKDIKPRKGNDEPFSSYKDQLSILLFWNDDMPYRIPDPPLLVNGVAERFSVIILVPLLVCKIADTNLERFLIITRSPKSSSKREIRAWSEREAKEAEGDGGRDSRVDMFSEL